MRTLKSMGKIETDIRIVVINGNEGLEVDLEFCFICFFNEKDLTQIWQSSFLPLPLSHFKQVLFS